MTLRTVYDVHRGWGWVVIISNAAVGVWALSAHRLPSLRHRALWWSTAVAQSTVIVQAVLGTILVGHYDVPLPRFHALYGFSAIIAVAIVYSYRVQMRHRLYLLYGGGGLFIVGLAIRAMFLDR